MPKPYERTLVRASSRRHKIAVIDGPKLSNLGARSKRLYRETASLAQLQDYVVDFGDRLGVGLETFSSNYEGAILEFIHGAAARVDGYLINPAGLTTRGAVVRRAVEATEKPVVEVHFANIHAPSTHPRGNGGPQWGPL